MVDIEQLRELQAQWRAENGFRPEVPHAMDVTRLPADDDWDEWAQSLPYPQPSEDFEHTLRQLDERQAAVAERTELVHHARVLLKRESVADELAKAVEDLRTLPARHQAQMEKNRSWLRASAAAKVVLALNPTMLGRNTLLTIRCPAKGCRLFSIVLRVDREPTAYREDLLGFGRPQRGDPVFAWITDPDQLTAFPTPLTVSCRHGVGKVPTDLATIVDRTRTLTRHITDVPGASWSPRG
jgi:hypothetical protein